MPEFNPPAARFSARPNLVVRPRRFLHRHARRDHSFYDFEFVHTYLRPQYAQKRRIIFARSYNSNNPSAIFLTKMSPALITREAFIMPNSTYETKRKTNFPVIGFSKRFQRALLLFFFVEDERNAVVVDGFDADIHLIAHAESANAVA